MLEYLSALSRLATKKSPTVNDVVQACDIARAALGAEEAYVICAGDHYYTRVGGDTPPDQYEIKQRGYWMVWQALARRETVPAWSFSVRERLVVDGGPLGEQSSFSHVASILPGDESNSDVLIVRGNWGEGLSEEQSEFLEAARPGLATLVTNVVDAERRARHQEQLNALADVARAFNDASEVDNAIQSVATALAKASGFDWVTIWVTDEEGRQLLDRAVNLRRHSDSETATVATAFDEGTMALARGLHRQGSIRLTPDVFAEDAQFAPDVVAYFRRAHYISEASFPLVFQEKLLGCIQFGSSTRREFSEPELNFLKDLVSQAATTIKGIRLYQELEAASRIQHFLARTDALTGIPNRRYIEEVMRAECARAQRYSEPVSLVMADLDYFKRINDTLGHDAGDDALKHVAAVARESCRDADFVGRWGGDEFLFILPVTALDGGIAFAERFRAMLGDTPFFPRGKNASWPMTISAGVAEATEASYANPDVLFKVADKALYEAKEGGRDRICTNDPRAAAA